MKDDRQLKEKVYATALRLCAAGLIRLSAGNVSARDENGRIAITPAGVPYAQMNAGDIVILGPQGGVLDGRLPPSSEAPMHTAVYRRFREVGAILHTHSVYAMSLAAVGMEIPVVCLEALLVGGPVPVARYACPGTAEAGEVACEVLAARPGLKALLLRNHGLVAIGEDLDRAFENACNCETAAEVYHLALQTGRTPAALTPEQMDEIRTRYPGL